VRFSSRVIPRELPWFEDIDLVDQDPAELLGLRALAAGRTTNERSPVDAIVDADRSIVERLLDGLEQLEAAQQILLFDLAAEQIRRFPPVEQMAFRRQLEAQFETADSSDFATWSMSWQLRRCLGRVPANPARPRYGKLSDIQSECEVLLSMGCHCGSNHEAMAQYAFQRAVVHLELRYPEFWSREELTNERLNLALEMVAELAPRPRLQFLAAVERSLSADYGLTVAETQFVRGLCAALDLPIPAWLPGQMISSSG
jgi:hypothetical protein